jgi:phytoene dehydrogenase-like protein
MTTRNTQHSQLTRADDARADAVVVGGGVAGLTAACYLARGSARVTLFERASELGGRAATQHVDGYTINFGAHALYTGGAATEVLRELDVRYRAAIPRHVYGLAGGRAYRLPTAPAGLFGGLLGWRDTIELVRLFARVARTASSTLGTTTVKDWLDANVRRSRVRQLMDAFARTFVYSAALDLVSADVFVHKLQLSLTHPIHYVEGGWQTLVDGLRRTAEAAGARIVTGTRVEAVVREDGRVAGVRTRDGDTIPAPVVVVATTPHEAAALLEGGAGAALRRGIEQLVPAQIACLDVALRTLPDPKHPVVFDLERPLFMTAHSRYVHVAPEGAGLIHTFKQLDPRHPAAPEDDLRDLESLLDAAQPGWRAALVRRSTLPRIAAAGALPLARSGGLAGRPGEEVPGLPGLYLAGDWVGREGFLVDASAASARRAAGLALRRMSRATRAAPGAATERTPAAAAA